MAEHFGDDDNIFDENVSDSEIDSNFVTKEIERVRGFVSGLSMEEFRSGDWFAKLLAFSLQQYVTKVDADYFKAKYPNLPPDAVVDARIKMAANYAAIEGALSSTAYSTAIAATISSAGAASPLTLPAGGATFVVDLAYTTYIQLQMTYDISVLYGIPLDINDPDDTWKLVKLAFGIKAGESAGQGVMKGIPVVVRPVVKQIFSGSTLAAAKSLPIIGKQLLQRNIIKFAIPGATIPITTVVNRYMTRAAGNRAKDLLRKEAQIIESAERIAMDIDQIEPLLQLAWMIANIDGTVSDAQRMMLHQLTVKTSERSPEMQDSRAFFAEYRTQINVDEDKLWEQVSQVPHDAVMRFFKAAVVVATVDGSISKSESGLLKEAAKHLGIEYDQKLVDAIKKQWKT